MNNPVYFHWQESFHDTSSVKPVVQSLLRFSVAANACIASNSPSKLEFEVDRRALASRSCMLSKCCRLLLKCDGTRAETRFLLSAKRTSPFKSAGASVQSTTGSRGVRISGSQAEYAVFRGSVKGTGYPLHSPVFPSLPLSCVTVCHHFSTGLY